jgi:hypothetical protein
LDVKEEAEQPNPVLLLLLIELNYDDGDDNCVMVERAPSSPQELDNFVGKIF